MSAGPRAPGLRCDDLERDPSAQLQRWIQEAEPTERGAARMMALCTVDERGRPSARNVTLRELRDGCLAIATNLRTPKGRDLLARPDAVAALFTWRTLRRQARVDLVASIGADEESDAWFRSSPRHSQLRAWMSSPTGVVGNRQELEERRDAALERFDRAEVAPPPGWSVVWLRPTSLELWQAGEDGVDDRFAYTSTDGGWRIDRLAP